MLKTELVVGCEESRAISKVLDTITLLTTINVLRLIEVVNTNTIATINKSV